MTKLKFLRAKEAADILAQTVQVIGLPQADKMLLTPQLALLPEQLSALTAASAREQQDPFLASLPDMAPLSLQMQLPQPAMATLLLQPSHNLPSSFGTTATAVSASASSVPMEQQQEATDNQLLVTKAAAVLAPVGQPLKRKRATPVRKNRQPPTAAKVQPSASAVDQTRLQQPEPQQQQQQLQQPVAATVASQPSDHSSSATRTQITDAVMKGTLAVVSTSSTANRVTMHVNNVASMAAEVFDELMAPAIETREMKLAKVKSAVLKRVLVKMVKTELLLNAVASSSDGGDGGCVMLPRFVDAMITCAGRLDLPVFDMSL